MIRNVVGLAGALLLVVVASGCAAGVGAGVAAGAYEYQNKQALDELEERYEAGEISREQYLEQREAIQSGSVVY